MLRTVLITTLAVLSLAALWMVVYLKMGIISQQEWERFWERVRGKNSPPDRKPADKPYEPAKSFEHAREPDEDEIEVFQDAFDSMDEMNVSAVESFKAYGHRTFYFTCGKCGQKNRLGSDLARFKVAGCGRCHSKFARKKPDADSTVN